MSLNRFQCLFLEEIGIDRLIYSKFIDKNNESSKTFSLNSNNHENKIANSLCNGFNNNNNINTINVLQKDIDSSYKTTFCNDISILKEKVVRCKNCFLSGHRKNVVFGDGVLSDVDCMIIGEAPGEYEDIEGKPFVGKSGKLLDSMLSSIFISRSSNAFISNIVKCRPPGNRNPRPEEIISCRPYLIEQIDIINPKTILALGKFSANTLLCSDSSIRGLRGKIHGFKSKGSSIPVVVSYHPAYLLRRPEEKSLAWADLCLIASLLGK
ncbi:DNA polymerase bacteriophage-type [Candidatus Kinetoplastibacterium blastocrithidii TCC012E]|uniref:Type-4 uracil-DNA glycosylase n=1 Tax=Candidatus Kinetoplastidibacterium blastocrithidiae TCC012E TaxID=1208922 RepID=M1LBT5_9PROT|nr:uracil-DNA glycosylase [Candidatus Kinetoplastibacterium blastocrithidii]AFZ83788.1 DNA polymerase bacteriophage-type [Candidatus Kinetoplastibacterium blastocrithidii (ex Strigomonas culicis)]AGF49913.1 DNA polymerase bacteriophage-type [Candidatus Kinetoplastibacterium blastocrithidii TCC012E]